MQKSLKFARFEKLIGEEKQKKLSEKCVLVLGCGGVGGYVIESFARSGVGKLIIIDYDRVDESNINRQLIALDSTIGRNKVDVWEERIHDISKDCQVVKIPKQILKENISLLFQEKVDYIVDACDNITTKKELIKECLQRKQKFISCMGMGNKLDPSQIEITELQKTKNDPLARVLRKYVKEEKLKGKIMVCSSKELPIKTKDRTPGSTAFVPSSAGLFISSAIIREWIKEKSD